MSMAFTAVTEDWWQVDSAYRQTKLVLQTPFTGYDTLSGWVDRFYRRFLSDSNQQWTAKLAEQGALWQTDLPSSLNTVKIMAML